MKAIATTDFGAPVTLVEISTPEPGEGEILVRVASSSINGFDLSVASGRLKGMMEHRFPVVLGKDFAGTVETIGAGVDDFAEGDTVFGVLMKPELGDGSFGERVATPAAFAARVPDGVDAATAGALGLAGTAAHDAVKPSNRSTAKPCWSPGPPAASGSSPSSSSRRAARTSSPPPAPTKKSHSSKSTALP